jgi:16S rRNA (uracil1498-N3)-methyltransferase
MPRTHQSLRRLFVPDSLGQGDEIGLDRESSMRLIGVLRMGAGDELVLFNGRDGAWLARIVQDSKRAVTVRLAEQIAPQPARPDLWYGFAPLKAARLDYMVQKATEMGVTSLQPVITRFTQVSRLKPERIRANAIEAAEQCEVLTVPEIGPEITLDALLDSWPREHGDRALVFADEASVSSSPVDALQRLGGRRVGLLIGPEGGFADAEREKLHAAPYVAPISLGPRILRADTAAVAALAVIQSIIGDWR